MQVSADGFTFLRKAIPSGIAFLFLTTAFAAPVIVNDHSNTVSVAVDRIATPTTVEDVQKLVREHPGDLSIGGARYSMGGQMAATGTLHLDMRSLNQILDVNAEQKLLRVQAGATWRQILERIDPLNLSVKVMQSFANFTVGGSLSVNVHGRYVNAGPIATTVRSIKIVTADGKLQEASREKNADLFWGSIGGYGALGVIVEATIELTENRKIQRRSDDVALKDYTAFFLKDVLADPKAIFHNGEIYPPDYNKVLALTWRESDAELTEIDRLMPFGSTNWKNRLQLFILADLPFGKDLRGKWYSPREMKKNAVVYRNFEAGRDATVLEPSSRKTSTFGLQEYFIPVANFDKFTAEFLPALKKSKANILNLSVRHTRKDPGTTMAWAREDVFAFVLYFKMGVSEKAQKEVSAWTRPLIDLALKYDGTYYLPYQLYAEPKQFLRAYPQAIEFIVLKNKYDPKNRFRNQMWDKYLLPPAQNE